MAATAMGGRALSRSLQVEVAAALACATLAACGGPGNPGGMDSLATREEPDAGSPGQGGEDGAPAPPDAPVQVAGYPAPHPAFPRVQTLGGPVLASPRVVPIFFANDPSQASIEDFLTQLAGSPYWAATTGEYGVGPLSVAPSIVVADAPPAMTDDATIMGWLGGYLDGTHAAFGAIDPSAIYAVFFPATTTIAVSSSGPPVVSCKDFGGYHQEGNAITGGAGVPPSADAGVGMGPSFVYAVLPRCATFNELTGLDALTAAASHEFIEASTDPLVQSAPAFSLPDFDHIAWALGIGGGEVGDMCVAETPDRAFQRFVGGYMVQRTWSNEAAEANTDPCVPAIADAYIAAAPDMDGTVFLDEGQGPALPTLGTSVPVGQSVTLAVRLFSTGPTRDWNVSAFETPDPGGDTTLSWSWDKQRGNNGDVLNLTVTRMAPGALGGTPLVIYSLSSSAIVGSQPTGDAWVAFIGN